MSPGEALAPKPLSSLTQSVLEARNGVTTGLVFMTVEQARSFDDRLGKAARKADLGDVAAAWIAVGRVQAEFRRLVREAQEGG